MTALMERQANSARERRGEGEKAVLFAYAQKNAAVASCSTIPVPLSCVLRQTLHVPSSPTIVLPPAAYALLLYHATI